MRHLMPIAILFAFSAGVAHAAPACGMDGPAPTIANLRLAADVHTMCTGGITVAYSPTARGAIWAAEYLTPDALDNARPPDRGDMPQPLGGMGADGDDYRGTDEVPLFLVPPGDLADARQRRAAAVWPATVPVAFRAARVWQHLDLALRHLAVRSDGLRFIAGATFKGRTVSTIGRAVFVPQTLFKAAYAPSLGIGGAYLCRSAQELSCRIVNLDTVRHETGIDPFPDLGTTASALKPLPQPDALANASLLDQ